MLDMYEGVRMTITFKEIGRFFAQNKLWFLIPLDIILTAFFIYVIVKYVKVRRKKNERKGQNKLHRTSKKTHKL